MTKLEDSTVIQRPVEAVWKYLIHVENIPRWDRGTLDARQTSEGPPGVGTTLRFIRKSLGRQRTMYLRYVEYEPSKGLAYEYTSGPFDHTVGRYTLDSEGSGTRLTCSGNVEYHGLYKLVTPILNRRMKRDEEADLAAVPANPHLTPGLGPPIQRHQICVP